MSVFLATVPAGTQLYHGTPSAEPVRGLEWLAFEPEHALIFAQPLSLHPAEGGGEPGEDTEDVSEADATPLGHEEQQRLGPATGPANANVGYLHTYTPRHDIHLLYIDGLSAGKTNNGTLDSQDLLILNFTTDPRDPFAGEIKRARGMCELASTLWEGKIDGIMRMEGGFEIILCDFEKHVDRTDLVAIKASNHYTGMFGDWTYMRAITARYGGIGGGRATLDYESFVSVFANPRIEGLFENDVQSDYAMPRLQNVNRTDLAPIRDEITNMILRKDWDAHMSLKNWQAIADLVVARYSEPLHRLHTDTRARLDSDAIEDYLADLLRPFIDYTARNSTLETRRCVGQIIPAQGGAGLAYLTVHAITYHICDTLLAALSSISSNRPEESLEMVDTLVKYLQWTTWKDCGGCPEGEICYIPIWPMGTHEDHAHPRCRSEADARERRGYWGFLL
ncbi:hypothetical protein DE146DRAFT_617103 [Phaeosphaeria sp. MPI-PUGE-AT-0046c]|nr:hypothetical protein DE146DRAFT_617103 [Phaeosphaeria sp. MPI-PUGE-AT-0046c]